MLFEQVVFNLFDNADKYSGPGTPTSVRATREAGGLVLAVEDRGRGIPPQDLERVFEKFTRLSAGDGRPAGTGLGLAIAKGVVEVAGGTIRAESPVQGGCGTRIVIRIPAADPHASLETDLEQEAADAGLPDRSGGG